MIADEMDSALQDGTPMCRLVSRPLAKMRELATRSSPPHIEMQRDQRIFVTVCLWLDRC